jgi:glycosyltransferase involved in cell wall biosynthesis
MKPNRRLRIAIYDPSGGGGICHYTFQLAENLTQAGCDVTVMVTEDYELKELPRNFKLSILFKKSRLKTLLRKVIPQILNGVSNHIDETAQLDSQAVVKETPRLLIIDFLKAIRLRMILLKAGFSFLGNRPHLIHFQWLLDRDADYYLLKLLKWFGVKVVYTAHDLLPHDEDTAGNRRLFKRIYQLVDKLIVHAESNKNEMIEIFNIGADKISIIPHGSNGLFFNHRGISREVARDHLGIPIGKKVILFFGLIKRYKGIEYLVQAFKDIKDQVEDAMLLIAGKVWEGDAELLRYYSGFLAQFNGSGDVRCVTGYIPFDEIGHYFMAADVVVLPYIKASQSGVLLAALAAGRPVVVTDTGGLSEIVENGRSGFVVPPKDAKALAEASIKILKSPELLGQMSREAKVLAETTYSWKGIALKTMDVYRSLNPSVSG